MATERSPEDLGPDDGELVRRARAGDRDAFTLLVQRHRPMVQRLCKRALGNRWQAEDAEQESLLLAYLHIDRLRRPGSFGPWLGGIALNLCRRSIEGRRRHPDARGSALEPTEPATASDPGVQAEALDGKALVGVSDEADQGRDGGAGVVRDAAAGPGSGR